MKTYEFRRVTPSHKCPICGKPDYCTYAEGLGWCCMRIQLGSIKRLKNGSWLHKNRPEFIPLPPTQSKPVEKFSIAQYFDWKARNDAPIEAQRYLNGLGVDPAAFYLLGAEWAKEYRAWAFPMRDEHEEIIGIQLRRLDGQKRAVKGSKNGLFISNQKPDNFVLICEGASDTAAALSMGFYAIGRQSCQSYAQLINPFLKRKGIKRAVLVTDNDNAGLQGIQDLSKQIIVPHCVYIPPAKDLREFYKSGGDQEMVETIVQQSVWKKPLNQKPV